MWNKWSTVNTFQLHCIRDLDKCRQSPHIGTVKLTDMALRMSYFIFKIFSECLFATVMHLSTNTAINWGHFSRNNVHFKLCLEYGHAWSAADELFVAGSAFLMVHKTSLIHLEVPATFTFADIRQNFSSVFLRVLCAFLHHLSHD